MGRSEAEIDLVCDKNHRFEQQIHSTAHVAKSLHHLLIDRARDHLDAISPQLLLEGAENRALEEIQVARISQILNLCESD